MDLNNYEFWRKNKRYFKALLAGFVSMILCAAGINIIFRILASFLSTIFGFSLLYIAAAYIIGESIRRFSHGVGQRFYVTAAVYTLLCIILARYFMAFGFGIPEIRRTLFIITSQLHLSLNNIFDTIWICIAVSTAYKTAESGR